MKVYDKRRAPFQAMQHPSFTADRNRNYNDFYGVLATVNPYCLVLSYYSLASSNEVKQNKQKILIHFSSAILFETS